MNKFFVFFGIVVAIFFLTGQWAEAKLIRCTLGGNECSDLNKLGGERYACRSAGGAFLGCLPDSDPGYYWGSRIRQPASVNSRSLRANQPSFYNRFNRLGGNRGGSNRSSNAGTCIINIFGDEINIPDTRCGRPKTCVPNPLTEKENLATFCREKNGKCGSVNVCKCLSFNTKIATPIGNILVTDLKVGMSIWTISKYGTRVVAPIIRINSVVALNHRVVHLVLMDGRVADISPLHPTATGSTVGALRTGDVYDGSVVKSATLIPYSGNRTYDILPAGDTGYYWANGILMGSTLK